MNNIKALQSGRKLLYAEDRVRVTRQISDDEANRLLRFGSIGWFEHPKKGWCLCMIPQPQQSRQYAHERSFGGGVIRIADIEENAMPGTREYGVNRYGGNDPEIVGNFTDHVLSKIEAYPFVGDTKAPRVSCRV